MQIAESTATVAVFEVDGRRFLTRQEAEAHLASLSRISAPRLRFFLASDLADLIEGRGFGRRRLIAAPSMGALIEHLLRDNGGHAVAEMMGGATVSTFAFDELRPEPGTTEETLDELARMMRNEKGQRPCELEVLDELGGVAETVELP